MAIRILTNHPGRVASPSWRANATYLRSKGSLWSSLLVSVRLYLRRRRYDCVVLGAGRSDLFYALLQALLPFGRRPTIMLDCLWYVKPNRFVNGIKTRLMRFADRSVDRYFVWASREIEAYSSAFGLPRHKFIFVPYHTTLDGHGIEPIDGDYLFSGGNFARDYGVLIRAVTGLPVTLHIASTRPELFTGLVIPANVIIQGYPHKEYLRLMAGCAINIVALAPGLLHSGGQQTFLNSMWLGKPTIVTDPAGARDYIDDGVDGVLVEPGDVEALRSAIVELLSNRASAKQMGQRARQKVTAGYSTEGHFQKIIALATELTGVDRPSRGDTPECAAPINRSC